MTDSIILAINPGSTSTKIALFKNEEMLYKESIPHPQEQLDQFDGILPQIPMREELVLRSLAEHGWKPEDLSIIMGRGGLLPPVKTGGYRVNQIMLDLILGEKISSHASNLGAVLAHNIAVKAGVDACIYDAVSASDFPPVAKITGFRDLERKSFCHVLNSRAAAIHHAGEIGKAYEDLNLMVAHLGGGITISAHLQGKIVDSIADDNGPFAPERAGSLPLLDIVNMCYSGIYNRKEMLQRIRGRGGLRDLLGTSDGRKIQAMVEGGDEWAVLVMEAQAYQIAKGIGMLTPALRGAIDAIILTGGLAYDQFLVEKVKERIGWLSDIAVLPGEFELEALARGGLRILRGEEPVNEMQPDINP